MKDQSKSKSQEIGIEPRTSSLEDELMFRLNIRSGWRRGMGNCAIANSATYIEQLDVIDC